MSQAYLYSIHHGPAGRRPGEVEDSVATILAQKASSWCGKLLTRQVHLKKLTSKKKKKKKKLTSQNLMEGGEVRTKSRTSGVP